MSFNEAPARALLLFMVAAGAAGSVGSDAAAPVAPTAQQAQALARARAALELDEAARRILWAGIEIAPSPLLVREARPGREPFVILAGHPAPPAGLARLAGQAQGEPAAWVGESLATTSSASPVLVAGLPSALYDLGDVDPQSGGGDPSAETEILGMVHQLAHVHLVGAGGSRFAHRAPPEPVAAYPESTALAGIESRILAEILFTAPGNRSYVEDLARQFLAARRARVPLLGDGAKEYLAAEVSEGLALFTEYESLRLLMGRQITPPGKREGESAYDAFKYGAVLRMTRIFTALLETPTEPSHAWLRAAATGAAQAVLLERLGAEWKGRILGSEAPAFHAILEELLPMSPREQEERLAQARQGFDFAALLAIARERAGRTAP